MNNTAIIIISILVVYFAAMLLIGLKGRKYSSTNKDFMTAAKQGTLLLVVGTYLGAHIGNGVVVGGAQYGAQYGIGGAWYGIGTAFSYILFAIVIAKEIRKRGYITLPDVVNDVYGDKITPLLIAVLHYAAITAVMAGQITAGKLLFEYLGMSGTWGAVITTLIVIIYSAMSGMWGVMVTDVIQSAVIFFSVIAGIIYIAVSGGFSLMANNLPASNWELIPFDTETFVMMFGPTMLYGLISAPGYQRTAACKKEKTVTTAPIIAAVIIIIFAVLPTLMGMYGKALWPDAEDGTILFKVLLEAFPPVLAGLMVASICAAVMSTCDGSLIACSANIVNDIYLKLINPKEKDEKKLARIAGWSTVITGVFGMLISLQFTNLVPLLSAAYALLNCGALIMIVGGIFWKKATTAGAIASFIVGITLCLLGNTLKVINIPYPSVTPLIPALVAFIVVSLLTQPKKQES